MLVTELDKAAYSVSSLAYMNFLPAYDLSAGVDKLLEIARVIQQCNSDYVWRGLSFPNPIDATIAPLESFEDQVPIEPESYILGINGYSSQPEGFELQIFDEGSQTYLFGKKMGKSRLVTGDFMEVTTPDDIPGQNWLVSPLVVLVPGQLNIQITNLSEATAYIQVLLNIAIPILDRSINQVEIRKVS